ncbi:MAG: DNA polymerase III subunit alpha [Treponema sp.]|jgi:DNA polymerase-3 subunit alpha|nr:DNA polymerase III subunit alpha [Treponema sp.]
MTEFVHLHVHSDFSLLDGAAPVKGLAAKARSLGMKHLAITDHGNMFGVLDFMYACMGDEDHPVAPENQVHPIIGCEFYMAPGSRFDKKGSENENKYFHLILLAASREGYLNLLKLSSLAYTEGFYYKPRIDEELLVKYHSGLICLSACIAGEIPTLIRRGKTDEAEAKARWFRDLMGGDNFYLEIMDHGLEDQRIVNAALVEMSRRTGIPLAATNDIHFIEKTDAAAQDALLCISTNKKRSDENRLRYTGNEYFKSGDEMAAVFPDVPEALSNTVRIAERCITDIPSPGPLLPDFEIPAGFSNADEYLRHIAVKGLAERYPSMPAEVKERAEYELDVIIRMGFTGYFLIVADFINWAKDRGIPVGPGRGSGAGSIVAYALKITDIDPLQYSLLFERFLNPERNTMPDFDVDFCNERREEVIDYVMKKYGKDRVGQIITFGTLGAKQVLKDVARVLDIPLAESVAIANLIPKDPKITLEKAFNPDPEDPRYADLRLNAQKLREAEGNPKYQELFDLARKLEGKKRHASLHAAGVVIGKTALVNYVPLYRDPKTGGIATQFTMGLLERQGLVKMDFLGLKTLDLIKNTEDIIRQRGGDYAAFSVAGVDEHDEKAYKILAEGRNEGIFQFEKTWWKDYLRQSQPSSIGELTALTSLGRPGPMKYIPQYITSKWDPRAIHYPDPCLEDILRETYGVIVYQEQVMQVAQRIAGYTPGQADLLRRAMGKKKKEIIEKEKGPFIRGAVKQGFSHADAERIYDILAPFAGYGFNKSHAAAYSLLSFRTAWLKAHFPAEFMAANLSNEINSPDKDKLSEYIAVTQDMGIPIDPPDVNRSDRLFTVVDGRIVYGLKAIKGIGDKPAEEIIACRKTGPYRDFMDFLDRINIHTVGKKVVELLIQTGAFDTFGQTRQTLIKNFEAAVEYSIKKKADRELGQSSLFEDLGEKTFTDFVFKTWPEYSRQERLNTEKALIGFYISGHPLDDYREAWEQLVTLDLASPLTADKKTYTLIGTLKSLGRPFCDKKGNEMCFGTLADYRGEISIKFFPETWKQYRDELRLVANEEGEEGIIGIRGRIDPYRKEGQNQANFIVNELIDLDKAAQNAKRLAARNGARPETPAAPAPETLPAAVPLLRAVHIRLKGGAADSSDALYPLRRCLSEKPGPCEVIIHLPLPEGETVIRTATQTAGAVLTDLDRHEAVAAAWGE